MDLIGLDKLRPRLARLTAILEKAKDSELALGSDIMVFSLSLYGLLKSLGVGAGLDELKEQMARRFTRRRRPEPPTPRPPDTDPRARLKQRNARQNPRPPALKPLRAKQ